MTWRIYGRNQQTSKKKQCKKKKKNFPFSPPPPKKTVSSNSSSLIFHSIFSSFPQHLGKGCCHIGCQAFNETWEFFGHRGHLELWNIDLWKKDHIRRSTVKWKKSQTTTWHVSNPVYFMGYVPYQLVIRRISEPSTVGPHQEFLPGPVPCFSKCWSSVLGENIWKAVGQIWQFGTNLPTWFHDHDPQLGAM